MPQSVNGRVFTGTEALVGHFDEGQRTLLSIEDETEKEMGSGGEGRC